MIETMTQHKKMIEALKSRNETLESQIEELTKAVKSAQEIIKKQQHQLEQLLKRIYGRKSEKYDPRQMLLDELLMESLPAPEDQQESAEEEAEEEETESSSKSKAKRKPRGRLPIPDHLERVNIDLDVPEEDRICLETGKPMVIAGYEESEKLEYRPGRLFVNVYRRPKYVSPDRINGNKTGVVTPPMPDYPIERCKADMGLVSHAIVSKFADHLPFYRQDSIFEREGVSIARSTLDGWALAAADAIMLLGEELKKVVLEYDAVHTDDTPVPLLEPGRGKTRTARIWVYIRGGPGPHLAAYDFTIDRRSDRPLNYLQGYQGYVQADAYSGYDQLFKTEGVIEVGCWCHARRKFDEALSSRPAEASEIMGMIGRMYAFEKQFRGVPPEARHQMRQTTVRPIVELIFERITEMRRQSLPSEPLRTAIDYALNQQDALRCFLEDGRLEPDNNRAENAIRPLAIGRKNWLFAGSERGGRAAALYLGLIQSCKACDVNPWKYFDDILRRIMSHPANRLRELLPDQWKPLPRDPRGLPIQD